MRIVILGYIVRGPLGGLAWHHFQYVAGLRQLGHEVLFMEDSDDFACCYNPVTFQLTTDPSYGLQFINRLFSNFDLGSCWAYCDSHTGLWHGRTREHVIDFCNKADIVLNLSGVTPLRDWWTNVPCRILVDTDPVFTQIKHLTDPKAMQVAISHTHFATYGANFGDSDCTIPDDGLPWKPTRQPLLLDAWETGTGKPGGNWTTVMQWDSYKSGEYNGLHYGMKSLSFKPFINLPHCCRNEKFEIALGSPNTPVKELEKCGWTISDPGIPSETPQAFQQYLACSKGEWTVAKHGYVITNSGWFSERTLNYMASAKPVVVQDTGFTGKIPTGKGILVFSSLEEAIEQVKKASKDYAYHCIQARKIAEENFDSRKVLTALLNII